LDGTYGPLASATAALYDFVKTNLRIQIDPVKNLVILSPVGNRGIYSYDRVLKETEPVANILQKLWSDESGQDIAEYAVMLAVILVIVVGTIRLIGSNANNVFSNVGSAIQ
jgi:Flp pilus assembly pilin Flp